MNVLAGPPHANAHDTTRHDIASAADGPFMDRPPGLRLTRHLDAAQARGQISL